MRKCCQYYDINDLYYFLSYVGQEPVLFAGTIADNIAYGIDRLVEENLDDAAVRERVYEAAKLANAHEFISHFPKG